MATTLEERRAKRETARARVQHEQDRTAAEIRARATAHCVAGVMRRGNAGQRWTFHTGGGLHADCHIIETVYGACPSATLEFTPSSIAVRSEERIRRVRLTMPGRFIGTIESASGHTLMAVFNNNDEQGDVAYAVGGSGVVGWLAEVYGFDYSTVRVRGLES